MNGEVLTEDDARMYIELLKKAKKRIRSGRNVHICLALSDIAFDEPEYENYADSLTRNIERILEPHQSLGYWWYAQRPGEIPTYEQAKEMRLRWIDDSIKSIKQKTSKSRGRQ